MALQENLDYEKLHEFKLQTESVNIYQTGIYLIKLEKNNFTTQQ